jgi:ABC-type Fe3+ transport system permease subunit
VTGMRVGTFSEALPSLRERCRKNIIKNRVMMILLWCQLALMLGIFCLYLVVRVSTAYEVSQIDAHPHQPASIDWLPNVGWIGFWLFVIGLPIIALILGICGVLPGTRRKKDLVQT